MSVEDTLGFFYGICAAKFQVQRVKHFPGSCYPEGMWHTSLLTFRVLGTATGGLKNFME